MMNVYICIYPVAFIDTKRLRHISQLSLSQWSSHVGLDYGARQYVIGLVFIMQRQK